MKETGAVPINTPRLPLLLAGNCERSLPGSVMLPALAGPMQKTLPPVVVALEPVPEVVEDETLASTKPLEAGNVIVKSELLDTVAGRLVRLGRAAKVFVADHGPTFTPPAPAAV